MASVWDCCAAAAILLVVCVVPTLGCQTASVETKFAAPAAKPPDSTAYKAADVLAHFTNQRVKFVDPTKTSFR
jgi:hypothetical protein